eukprot:174166-Karenia_brevis.AAC.1
MPLPSCDAWKRHLLTGCPTPLLLSGCHAINLVDHLPSVLLAVSCEMPLSRTLLAHPILNFEFVC